jgi:RNA polymerase sigma-70 factor (ECF subfamily)
MDALARLASAAAEGDDAALTRLVRETQATVWRLCRHLVSADAADDLTQETYLRALGSLRSYRGDAAFSTWLLGVARRVCADHLRRSYRRARLAGRLGPVPQASPGPSTDLEDLCARLEPARREAFVLTQVVGLSYEEAARVCGCPVGTIRSRVARARAELVEAIRRAEAR